MLAQVFVADSATWSPDRTVSAIRMGITQLHKAPGVQGQHHKFCIVACLHFEAAERGTHEVRVSLRDADGQLVIPEATVEIASPEECATTFLPPMPVVVDLQHGSYEVNVVVDGMQRATWPLRVTALPAPELQDVG